MPIFNQKPTLLLYRLFFKNPILTIGIAMLAIVSMEYQRRANLRWDRRCPPILEKMEKIENSRSGFIIRCTDKSLDIHIPSPSRSSYPQLAQELYAISKRIPAGLLQDIPVVIVHLHQLHAAMEGKNLAGFSILDREIDRIHHLQYSVRVRETSGPLSY